MVKGKQHIVEMCLTRTRDKRLFMLQRPGWGQGEQCDRETKSKRKTCQ